MQERVETQELSKKSFFEQLKGQLKHATIRWFVDGEGQMHTRRSTPSI